MFRLIRFLLFLVSDFFCKSLFLSRKNILTCKSLKLKGWPVLQVHPAAKVRIGTNVTLNSRNYGYHAHMHSPIKIMADRANAEIEIGDNTRINGACLHAYKKIKIGKNCLIAANVQIIDSNGHELSFENIENRIKTTSEGRPIIIEDNVWIGLNAIVLPGITIGNGAVIGANTVVSKDVPAMSVYAGNPGSVVKRFLEND